MVDNGGARFVAGLLPNYNHHNTLRSIKEEFNIDVQQYFVKAIMRRIGHLFWHDTPLRNLLSFPLARRLAFRRLQQGGGFVSDLRQAVFQSLRDLGVDVDDPTGGRPGVRGQTSYVHRWGDPWFEEVCDNGDGWHFQKNDTDTINQRTSLLLQLLRRPRRQTGNLALEYEDALALGDEDA